MGLNKPAKIAGVYLLLAFAYFSEPLLTGHLLASGDAWLQSFPLRIYYGSFFLHHGIHWWLPYEFLGMPFLGSLQTGLLYPPNFIYFFLPPVLAFNLSLLAHYAMAAFFTYLYARLLGLDPAPAFFSGLIFGFSGFLMVHKGHISMVNSGVWLPLLFYFCEKLRRGPKIKYAILGGMVLGIQILAGHPQLTAFSVFALLLYVLFGAFNLKEKRARFLILAAFSLAFGIAAASPQIAAGLEIARYAWHGHLGPEILAQGSFSPRDLPMLFFPYLFGGGYSGVGLRVHGYFVELSGFTGIFSLVAAIWIFFKKFGKNRHVRFFGGLGALALILTFGGYSPWFSPLTHVPLLNLFRVPARHWFEFDFAVAVLFGFAVQELLIWQRVQGNRLWLSTGILFAAILGSLPWPHSLSWGNPAYWVPLLFAAAYLIWLWFFYGSGRIRSIDAFFLLGLFVFGEGFSLGGFYDANYPTTADVRLAYHSPLFLFMKQRIGEGRFAFFSRMKGRDYAGLPLVNIPMKLPYLTSYDPLMLKSVGDFLGMNYLGYCRDWPELLRQNTFLSLLTTRFVVIPNDPAILREAGLPNSIYPEAGGTGSYLIFENTRCFPKAFAVSRLLPEKGIGKIRASFLRGADPRQVAFVSPGDYRKLPAVLFSPGQVSVVENQTDRVTLRAFFKGTGFVVLADQFYPGWHAQVDGVETKIYKADGLLRGVVVQAGNHQITFHYAPTHIYWLLVFSGFALIAGVMFLAIDRSHGVKANQS